MHRNSSTIYTHAYTYIYIYVCVCVCVRSALFQDIVQKELYEIFIISTKQCILMIFLYLFYFKRYVNLYLQGRSWKIFDIYTWVSKIPGRYTFQSGCFEEIIHLSLEVSRTLYISVWKFWGRYTSIFEFPRRYASILKILND